MIDALSDTGRIAQVGGPGYGATVRRRRAIDDETTSTTMWPEAARGLELTIR
ncbi:hypothetical protein [Nocardia lijiangensis]|uniref:hypothetical protein n=1 Tax=Nocardia lijiangensis TaxID=299618 RepID=UPI003D71E984